MSNDAGSGVDKNTLDLTQRLGSITKKFRALPKVVLLLIKT